MHFTLLHDFDNWINLKHKEEIVRMFFRRYLMCLNVMIILLTCSLYKQVKCVFILVNDSICYIPLALHDVMNFYASKIFYQQLCHFCFKVLSDEFSYYFKFFCKVFKFWFKKIKKHLIFAYKFLYVFIIFGLCFLIKINVVLVCIRICIKSNGQNTNIKRPQLNL